MQLPADLADQIVAERMAPTSQAGDFTRNLAVARVEITDRKTGDVRHELISAWNLEKQHAEPLLLRKVSDRQGQLPGKTVKVTHLYTERIPCGNGGADCQWVLKQKEVPTSNVFYSVEVRDNQLAKKLESHYGPYRRNIPRPPSGGGRGGAGEPPPKAPKPKRPKGSRRAGKAAAGVLAAGIGGADPQPAQAATRAIDQPATIDRATTPSQRMVDPPSPAPGTVQRGTAGSSRAVPAKPPQPRVLTAPPVGTPPAGPRPVVAEKGTRSYGRVTLDYDFTGAPKRDAVKVRQIDLSDFFTKESRVTRLIKAPALRKLAAASAPTAASLLTSWGLGKIKEHFSGFIREARRNFEGAFPPAIDRGDLVDLDDHRATLDALIDELGQPIPIGTFNLTTKEILKQYLAGMFDYEEVNLVLQDELARDIAGDLPDIYEDIGVRANVLARISNNLEDAFIWIHSHVFGSNPIVYYASFDLWLVRDIFHDLAGEMSDFHSDVYTRKAEYQKFVDKLADDLNDAAIWLDFYRPYWDKNRHLLD